MEERRMKTGSRKKQDKARERRECVESRAERTREEGDQRHMKAKMQVVPENFSTL